MADAVFDENTFQFLGNLYRKNQPATAPAPGMALINLARAETPLGEPIMSERELAVFVSSFETSGFTGSVNWYRNIDRNWHLLACADPIIQQPTLMIYGNRDTVQKSETWQPVRSLSKSTGTAYLLWRTRSLETTFVVWRVSSGSGR